MWRDLIADEVEFWLADRDVYEDSELLEFIRTGETND